MATPRPVVNIAHIASHSINVGDGAIINGIQESFRDYLFLLNKGVKFTPIDIVDFINPEPFTAEQLDSGGYDLIIVGGGGTIDGARREESGFAFRMTPEELRKLRTPIAFCGIGHNLFNGRDLQNGERLREFIETCGEIGIPFSVRNDQSLQRLCREFGIGIGRTIDVIPDPGFYINTGVATSSALPFNGRRKVMLQFSADNLGARFGNEDMLREVMNTVLTQVYDAAESRNLDIVFAMHTTPDLFLAATAISAIQSANNSFVRDRVRVLEIGSAGRARDFFSNYKECDLVIGMRGHSVICATGLGTPVIALSTHPKVEGYMQELGLTRWTVTPQTLDKLGILIEELLNNPQRQLEIVNRQRNELWERFHAFIEKAVDQIK